MYSYTAATLAIRAKCSLSHCYLSLPDDQPHCCHLPCCHFPVSPRMLSGYLLGMSSPIPSRTLLLAGRWRLRVFRRSRDPEMKGLLAEPEERFPSSMREVKIKSVEGESRGSRKDGKAANCSLRRSDGLSSVASSSSTLSPAKRRARRESLVGYDNIKKGNNYDAVIVVEEEAREVQKHVNDSWREWRYSSKSDDIRDSRKDEPLKTYGSFTSLAVEGVAKKIDRSVNSAQQVNSRENGSDRRSQKATRVSDVQSDDLKRTSVSANVKKIEKGDSLASAARQSSVIDHQGAGHSELRRGKQSKMADLNVQSAAYPRRDFEETSIRGREEQDYMEQNSAQVTRDKRIHLDQRAVEQDESRRNKQRLSQVSVYHGSDFESSSRIDDKRVMRTDLSTVLVQDSGQVPRNERFQSDLQMSVENKSKEREEKLTKAGNSIQLRGERKWIDRGTVVQDEARRNAKILSEVSQIHSGSAEPFSLYRGERVKGMEFRSDFVQSSIPSTKDKGTQVEMNEAYHDQIEVSRFNADNIVDATSSRSPPESRVDSQEYSALLASNQISSRRDQPNQAGMQAYRQSVERVESERDANEFDLTRVNTRRISSLQETYHSRIENLKETSSAETSSVVLAQQRKERQRSSITGESSQSASMQMDSTGTLHGISSSQPTYNEQHHHGSKVDIRQIQNDTVGSSRKLDKSSGLYAGKFVDKPQKEIVALKESGKAPIVSVGIQMREPGKRDFQATLGTDNQKETSLTVVTQERKEIDSSLFLQSKTMQMASTGSFDGVSSTVKTHSEVDNDSDRDDILKSTNYAIESAERLDKSSAFHVDEFVDEIQQEMMSLNKSGKEPNVSTGFQTEETGRRESQSTSGMQVGELTQNRRYEDGRYIKEGGRLSSSGSGMRGPSDEMWDVQGISSQETTHAEEPEENSPSSGAMGLTTPTTMETAITRRSPKSLWSYVADIIRMSWILRGHSHSSTLKSDKRTSSNESLSSEAWFSGPEPDEDGAGDETQNMEKIGLLKESAPVKESVELSFKESKNGDRLTVTEPHSPISSGFMTSGLSARTASSSVEAEHTDDSKSSQGIPSSVPIAEQKLASKADAAPPSISDIVESRIRDKVKVLKPSSSYPVGVMRTGFSSSITEATCVEQMEAAQVREGNYSSLDIFELPLVSTADSALPKITDIDEVDMPGNSMPKLELDPFIEKQPEVGGIKEAELKRRKVQRNNQVRRVQFDEWEEAFKRENDQKKLDEYFMREAILEAKKGADIWEVPVGAVLVQNGKIIARGCNRVEELRDSTAHAEMICIREASNLLRTWRLAETTLYVTLEPCPMCAGAILQARIDTVVWGAPNRLLGADGSWVRLFPGGDGGSSSMNPPSQMVGPVHPFHPNITIRRGVLETECGDVMQQFFKLRRKKDKKPESSPASCLPISNRPTKFFTKLHNLFCMMFCL